MHTARQNGEGAHPEANVHCTCHSAGYCLPDRYWHSVSPPGLPAGKIPRSGERCANQYHELPEAKRRAKFMVLMSTPNGATQEFYCMIHGHGAHICSF